MNIIALTGNLGNDPEVFFSTEGTQVTSFSLAFRSGKQKTGWIKVVCFNKTAELAQKHLHKGAKINVNGMLDQEEWKPEGGEKKRTLKVIANSLDFLKTDGRGFEGKDPGDNDSIPF